MTIRITQGSLYARSLSDIQYSLRDSVKLQQQISTGLRVNRPSDDPAAALRIIPLKGEIRDLDRMLNNISLARESLNTGAASLEDASSIVQRIRELTVQGANGSISEGDRKSIAEEVDQLLEQMVSVANAQRGGRYLFGGTETGSPPFSLSNPGVTGQSRVSYVGNSDQVEVEIAPGVETAVNQPGDAIFMDHDRSATTFTGSTGAAPGPIMSSGVGFDTLDVAFSSIDVTGLTGVAQGTGTTTALGAYPYTFNSATNELTINGVTTPVSNGQNLVRVDNGLDTSVLALNLTLPISPLTGTITSQATLSIDGGASTELVDFSSSVVRVRDSVDGSILDVDVSSMNTIGKEEIEYGGTFDIFTTMISIRDLLRNDSGDTPGEVSASLSSMLDRIDTGHDDILDGLRSLGFRSSNMELMNNRVSGLKQTSEESLSQTRDTDIVEAIINFNRQDTIYQGALQVGSRVVQVSLLNFLR